MPMIRARYRFKMINPNYKVRLAFDKRTNKVVEVEPYVRKNKEWVKGHSRRIKR